MRPSGAGLVSKYSRFALQLASMTACCTRATCAHQYDSMHADESSVLIKCRDIPDELLLLTDESKGSEQPLGYEMCRGKRQEGSTDRPVWHVLVGYVPLGVLVSEGVEAVRVLQAP